MQARFRREHVAIAGKAAEFERTGDDGNRITLRFCPDCGSTLYWSLSGFPDLVAVAVGNFADPAFPAPRISVYERRRHPWVVARSAPIRCAAPLRVQPSEPNTLKRFFCFVYTPACTAAAITACHSQGANPATNRVITIHLS